MSEKPKKQRPPAFSARQDERNTMVKTQIMSRSIHDPNILQVMRIVPRHAFVPQHLQRSAYQDHPLPIGNQQTISQPYIVAFMTQALSLDPNDKVLEIGTGSGYQAAVCAEMGAEVYTLEIIPELGTRAEQTFQALNYTKVHTKIGDGYHGWPEYAPYDAIIGTAAAGKIPPPLLNQLKPGGRMILPLHGTDDSQSLTLIKKDLEGNIIEEDVLPVRFVPMTGKIQEE